MRKLKRPPVFREDGTIEIRLTRGYVAVIDAEDIALAAYNWCAMTTDGKTYAVRNVGPPSNRMVYLHVEVCGPGNGLCDHRNGDTMNCRRGNLRRTSPLVNTRNRRDQKNNTSGHMGVHMDRGLWRAVIGRKKLGRFRTLEEAVAARLAAEVELWGIEPVRAAAHSR